MATNTAIGGAHGNSLRPFKVTFPGVVNHITSMQLNSRNDWQFNLPYIEVNLLKI